MDDFEAETRDPNIGEKGTGTETGTEAGSRMGKETGTGTAAGSRIGTETGTAAGSWMGTVIAAVVVVVGTPCLESLILSILVRVAALVGRVGGGLTAIVGRKLMLLPGPVGVEPKDAATIVSGISAAVGRISVGVQGTDGDNMGHGGSDLGGGDVGEVNGKMAVSVRAICAIIVGEVGEEDCAAWRTFGGLGLGGVAAAAAAIASASAAERVFIAVGTAGDAAIPTGDTARDVTVSDVGPDVEAKYAGRVDGCDSPLTDSDGRSIIFDAFLTPAACS